MSEYESAEWDELTPTHRLAMLDVELPEPASPAGAYQGSVRTGDLLFTAGQLPLADGELLADGRVGDAVDLTLAQQCARQCVINVLAQVPAAGLRLDDVRRVVKLTVFVASDARFTDQHLVANGASELLGEVFGDAGRHARSAVGVAVLPMDSPVEIEAVLDVGGH